MTTFHQLQHILEQSLRDLHDEPGGQAAVDELELSQALHRLTGRLNTILAEASDSYSPSFRVVSDPSLSALPSDVTPLIQGPIHFMTSCEGVVILANDAAVNLLNFDLASIGTLSLAEWISHEEWQFIRQQLKHMHPSREPLSWVVNMRLSDVVSEKMECSVTPLLDQSRNVTSWHWELRRSADSSNTDPFGKLVQGLEDRALTWTNA